MEESILDRGKTRYGGDIALFYATPTTLRHACYGVELHTGLGERGSMYFETEAEARVFFDACTCIAEEIEIEGA